MTDPWFSHVPSCERPYYVSNLFYSRIAFLAAVGSRSCTFRNHRYWCFQFCMAGLTHGTRVVRLFATVIARLSDSLIEPNRQNSRQLGSRQVPVCKSTLISRDNGNCGAESPGDGSSAMRGYCMSAKRISLVLNHHAGSESLEIALVKTEYKSQERGS